MKLTENFTLAEFEKSETASRRGIDNRTPDDAIRENLKALCVKVLQPVRDHFQQTVRINSGYRCHELTRAVGSSTRSQHCLGEAADIEIMGLSNYELAEWIRDNVDFDQLILENYTKGDPNSGWVHVSFCSHKQRKQVLTAVFNVGKAEYTPGLNA